MRRLRGSNENRMAQLFVPITSNRFSQAGSFHSTTTNGQQPSKSFAGRRRPMLTVVIWPTLTRKSCVSNSCFNH